MNLAECRVLVVEDNTINQTIAKNFLKKLEIDAALAGNGKEAVDLLEKTGFDLILMDCQMPVMDGLEATRIIKQNQGSASPVIIALTASAMAEDQEKCLAAGMDDFLTKPIRSKDLKQILSKWLDDDPAASANQEVTV